MREQVKFHSGWKFHEGGDLLPYPTVKSSMYNGAKTERAIHGFAAAAFGEKSWGNPYRWESVTLPHDYLIDHDSDPEQNETLGFFHYTDGCYRKKFIMPAEDAGKRITLYFEGVASDCSVYLNGCLLGENHSAYNSFSFELNPYLRFGEQNTLVVLVRGDAREGWWYAGAGIIRDVWLCKTELVSVERDGIYALPVLTDPSEELWTLPGELTLRNDDTAPRTVTAHIALDGLILHKETVTLPPEQVTVLSAPVTVAHPTRWDISNPHLYTVTVSLWENDRLLDEASVRTGFRTAEFTKDGFFLNGRRVQIHGVCCHEDYAITGRVVPYAVKELRLQKLMACGVNAYRCAHYQQSADTMDLLDQLGLLVMAENRHFEPYEPYLSYFAAHLRRDRNHPSVILWSTSNEEFLHTKPQGAIIQHKLARLVRSLDATRAITCAVNPHPINGTVYEDCDVIGMNYNVEEMDAILEKYPDKPVIMTECVASATTRGWYGVTDKNAGYMYGFDNKTYDFGNSLEQQEQMLRDRTRFAGGFVWAGVEHRGEAYWPRLFSQAGMLDAALHFKDSSWLMRSQWRTEPVLHLLPHWNHVPGQKVPVWAYTNCDEVELFVNGQSEGRQTVPPVGHGEWEVTYAPGELSAIGYRNGAEVTRETVTTAGRPDRLELILENQTPFDEKRRTAVVTCRVVDAQGTPVPDASLHVRFAVSGGGRLLGTFGSVCDHNTVCKGERDMFMGLCSAAVELPAEGKSPCTLNATCDFVLPASLELS